MSPTVPMPALPIDQMSDGAKAFMALAVGNIIDGFCFYCQLDRPAGPAIRHELLAADARQPRTRSGLVIVTRYGTPWLLLTPWGALTFPSIASAFNVPSFMEHLQVIPLPCTGRPEISAWPNDSYAILSYNGQAMPEVQWPEWSHDQDQLERRLYQEWQALMDAMGGRPRD